MSESEIKFQVRRLLDLLSSQGTIEETGQKYTKVQLTAIFDSDKKELYNILEYLKKLSE